MGCTVSTEQYWYLTAVSLETVSYSVSRNDDPWVGDLGP